MDDVYHPCGGYHVLFGVIVMEITAKDIFNSFLDNCVYWARKIHRAWT